MRGSSRLAFDKLVLAIPNNGASGLNWFHATAFPNFRQSQPWAAVAASQRRLGARQHLGMSKTASGYCSHQGGAARCFSRSTLAQSHLVRRSSPGRSVARDTGVPPSTFGAIEAFPPGCGSPLPYRSICSQDTRIDRRGSRVRVAGLDQTQLPPLPTFVQQAHDNAAPASGHLAFPNLRLSSPAPALRPAQGLPDGPGLFYGP